MKGCNFFGAILFLVVIVLGSAEFFEVISVEKEQVRLNNVLAEAQFDACQKVAVRVLALSKIHMLSARSNIDYLGKYHAFEHRVNSITKPEKITHEIIKSILDLIKEIKDTLAFAIAQGQGVRVDCLMQAMELAEKDAKFTRASDLDKELSRLFTMGIQPDYATTLMRLKQIERDIDDAVIKIEKALGKKEWYEIEEKHVPPEIFVPVPDDVTIPNDNLT